ncbi:MAG: chemotaxis protein CheW, partial [Sulfuricurvum sp.]|nr:chemotaxis protein CheW [Sulfuricurvum sp.]
YTVYTNLFIYDSHANIIASSNNPSIIGRKVSGDFITKTLNNQNSQNYFVSNFEQSSFYNDEATYIYNASITSNGKMIGGIGIVFDSTPQFKAILQDSFPSSKNGFGCFIDRKGMIISTTHPVLQPMERIELDDEIMRFNSEKAIHRFIDFQGKRYLVGIALSHGYREYKVQDNYKNDVLSLTFIEY